MARIVSLPRVDGSKYLYDGRKTDSNAFRNSYPGAFSASDIYALIQLPGGSIRGLGNLAALSISTHRDSFPVTSLAGIGPRGFTQGHRTTAGTLIFHTVDRGAFDYGLNGSVKQAAVTGRNQLGKPHPDSLPLFDIYITYTNEVGMAAYEVLYGVRLLDLGKTLSLESLHPMESYSYMALGYSPLTSLVDSDEVTAPEFVLNSLERRGSVPVVPDTLHSVTEPGALDPLLNEDLASYYRRIG